MNCCTLKIEMDKMRKRSGQTRDLFSELEEARSEIKILKEIVESMEKEEDKIYSKLQVENEELKQKISNLLRCDDCGINFNEKTLMKKHNEIIHLPQKSFNFKCNVCDMNFDTKENLKAHTKNEHRSKRYMEDILRKENQILAQVSAQKIKLHKSLFKLKQKEEMQRLNCSCRGFCRIVHAKYRWIPSQSNILHEMLNSTNPQTSRPGIKFNCDECDRDFNSEEILKTHLKSKHESDSRFNCHDCDQRFDRDEDLQCHSKKDHVENSDDTYECKCQLCEKTFPNEDSLLNHMEEHHEKSVLEKTFFNPSASL